MKDGSVIYPSMWRGTFVYGVPMLFLMLAGLVGIALGAIVGLVTGVGALGIGGGAVIGAAIGWPVGLVLTRRDPDFMDIAFTKAQLSLQAHSGPATPKEEPGRVYYQ